MKNDDIVVLDDKTIVKAITEELIKEADYYLHGTAIDGRNGQEKPAGLRNVAEKFGKSVVTIHDDLSNRLYKYDTILYAQVAKKLEENKPQTITDQRVIERVMKVYKLYVEHGMYIPDIAEALGEKVYTIYNDLRIRLVKLYEIMPGYVTKAMIDKVDAISTQNVMGNLPNLEDLYPNPKRLQTNISGNEIVQIYQSIIRKYIPSELNINIILHTENRELSSSEELQKYEMERILKEYNKDIKISLCAEIFIQSNYTLGDEQISALIEVAHTMFKVVPAISSSSVQRYLTDPKLINLYGGEIAEEIAEKRRENLQKGKVKGGEKSTRKNSPDFDEAGKFSGSHKETRKKHDDIKQLLISEAKLFLSGMTIQEIATEMSEELEREINYFEVRRDLKEKLKKYDLELSEQVLKLFAETELKKQEEKKKEMLAIYDMYINKNMSLADIAKILDINKSNVSRRLGSGLESLMLQFPEEITKEMVEKVDAKKAANEGKTQSIPTEASKALSDAIDVLTSDDIESLYEDESGMGSR